jgi:ubiquinone/menaquinone biosynthesis C-methylase UbiE
MSSLVRTLEPEVMDTVEEALLYDAMDHQQVNHQFVSDLLALEPNLQATLDVGTGTALIPILLASKRSEAHIIAIDLAHHMLERARRHVVGQKLQQQITLQAADAKQMPWPTGTFTCVVSNSIIHHIPEPQASFAEKVRVLAPGGLLFVRDLVRPDDEAGIEELMNLHVHEEPRAAQVLFEASLRAALSLSEIKTIAQAVGIPAQAISMSSDRHWTLSWIKAN